MARSDILYAIGDVHGRADLLESLLAFIKTDAEARGREPKLVFLGDLLDRGPDSRRALELVAQSLKQWPQSRLILGNHDDVFLRIVTDPDPDPDLLDLWFLNGGGATLVSYGWPGDLVEALTAIQENHPHHLDLLRDASLVEIDDPFLFVHAGIDPTRPISTQWRQDCLTIREPFLDYRGPLSHLVVHGHSITESLRPEIAGCRIALDTGAFGTGRLTALIIDWEAMTLEFVATTPGTMNAAVEVVLPVVLAQPILPKWWRLAPNPFV
ncbi:metallophosphoesterase [Microvirga brassicacearum]|uniref:metallophosphoesterase n=1 Tax=Microvirga brassicacearum TaxID=2580413 RepID=UPI001390ABAC|nr:metallophosphoesterase [Microvirga brassicacearum]